MKKGSAFIAIILLIQTVLMIAAIVALFFEKHETFQDLLLLYLVLYQFAERADKMGQEKSAD